MKRRWLLAAVCLAGTAAAAYLLFTVTSAPTDLSSDQGEPGARAAEAPEPMPSSSASSSAMTPAPRATAASAAAPAGPDSTGPNPAIAASRQTELRGHIRKASEPEAPDPATIPRDPARDRSALAREEIRAAIKAVTPLVRGCYEERLKEKAELEGKAVIRFTIVAKDGEGRIDEGEIKRSTLDDLRLDTCMLHALTKARFPLPQGEGKVTVTYPFVFRPAEQ